MKLFLELNQYLIPYRWKMFWGISCIVLSKIFSIYPAQLIRQAFDYLEQAVYNKDLFILLAKNRIVGHNHNNQKHARKFHSYFLVLIKQKHPCEILKTLHSKTVNQKLK